MTFPHPKFRRDLVVSYQGAAGAVIVVVKDPASGRFFRFRETEGFLLQQLDGVTPLAEVGDRAEEKFSVSLPVATLEQFVRKLRDLGLLEVEAGAPVSEARPRGRIQGNAFYLRWRAIDPDRLFNRLISKIKFFFTPSFVFWSGAFILVAGVITISNWSEIRHDFQRLYSFQSLLLAYATTLVVIAFHEFAHGLTCKFFGGSVREIGFLLLFFQPAFYCNVSDAWLFPEKSKRLWVTFAGAFFEIFLWALSTLIWWFTDPHTLVNYMALVVMATSGIKALFNLNPLIKLDGYYLLSDYLDIPNLRQRSFTYLGDRIRKFWGSMAPRLHDASPREIRIYLVYGLLAWLYSFLLLSIIALSFGGFLVGRYQGWGLGLFAILLVGLFQHPLKKLLRPAASLFTFAPGMWIFSRRPIKLGILTALLATLFLCRMELRIAGPFIVLPLHNADVRAEVEGIIQELYAEEGDYVKKGDLIASLADRDYSAELGKIKAEIEERQARLNLLKAGSRPEEIELQRTLMSKADERIKFARIHLEMDKTLFQEKLVSQKEYEETKELLAVRENELKESQDRLRILLAGSRLEEIEATQAELNRLKAQERYLDVQLGLLKIPSPAAGVIITHKLKDKIGQAVKKGDLIAKVHEMKTVTVEIAIPEKEIADVKVGGKVFLKAQAYPGTLFEGSVTTIAPVATKPEDWRTERTVLVTTQLDNSSGLLKPEMTGNAKIYCGSRRLIDLLSRRFVRYIRVEFWSWW